MKIGIIVPFSWSYPGGVVEHAENQAEALRARGHEVLLVMGHDPPGRFTRLLHPRSGRHGDLPAGIIPVGRSVVVPANGSLPNIVLSPRSIPRLRRVLAEQRFDVVHLHEPMTPTICVASLSFARCAIAATWHAAGTLGWMRGARHTWGFLADRVDCRIAVSRMAAESAQRWLGSDYEIIPNGVLIPAAVPEAGRERHVVFIGRHEARKGLPVLLRAWPEIRRRSGARLRLIGTDPLQYRLLHSRLRFDEDGIDVLGIVPSAVRDAELASAALFVSPALGGESFGMVLVEAFAHGTPVVASNIPGFADVVTTAAAALVAPGDGAALADAVVALLAEPERARAMGRAGRAHVEQRYSWTDVARRLEAVYERIAA
jgi:phosphatidylinositol alpha-mannosyltransferase